MYPRRTLIVAGLLAFLLSLAFMAPARLLIRLAPELAHRVSDVSGTLWHGALKTGPQQNPLHVSWDLHAPQLLLLQLAFDWTVQGEELQLGGSASLAPWGRHLQIESGQVGGGRLGRLFAGTQTQIDQPLMLQGVDIDFGAGNRVEQAAGRLAWGPGRVSLSSRPEPLALPALHGVLRAVDGRLRLQIDGEQEPGALLASMDVSPVANELHLVVTHRGARVAGVATAAPVDPGKPFFELRQPLR